MTEPVKFETAKLLKEKGWDKRTSLVWLFALGESRLRELDINLELTPDEYNAPTIAEVVMWLYEKHEIWVQGPFPYNDGKWEWVIFLLKEPLGVTDGYKNVISLDHEPYKFNSPTEAYESAIEYTLNDLI